MHTYNNNRCPTVVMMDLEESHLLYQGCLKKSKVLIFLHENFILKCKAFKETDEITYQIPAEGNILREVIITYKVPEDIVSQLNRFLILFELQLRLATPSPFSPHPHPQ